MMNINLKIVRVDSEYCEYLRKFDNRVTYNKNTKELRPFIGVLFKINDCEYFAPLSSPKAKHVKMKDTIDFMKIKNGELGAVNFNNMIPVKENLYTIINLNKKTLTIEEFRYQKLLKEQLDWLNTCKYQVRDISTRLYTSYNNGNLPENVLKRCCDFKLLEKKCEEYAN